MSSELSGTGAPGRPPTPSPSGPAQTDFRVPQADIESWLSRRGALLAVVIAVALLIAAVVVCVLVWITPAMSALDVPMVPSR